MAANNLAWVLATNPDAQLRNGAEAVQLAERACELSHNEEPMFIGTLGAAYAEAGRFQDAVATAKRAHALALQKGLPDLAQRNAELLKLYEAGKPFRDEP
jgi:Flp pilus assembly protein TadD